MFAELRDIYRQSLKPSDSLFNRYIARPLATPVVRIGLRLGLTPNQLSLLGLIPLAIGALTWALWLDDSGLWFGLICVELAYVIDCADGQLARMTHRVSDFGATLDFTLDEVKATIVIAALGLRWGLSEGPVVVPWLVTMCTVLILTIALALTRLKRSQAYADVLGDARIAHGGAAGEALERTSRIWPIKMVFRIISQYPVGLPIFVLFNRIDVFVFAYGLVHLLYCGQVSLEMSMKLRRHIDAESSSASDGRPE